MIPPTRRRACDPAHGTCTAAATLHTAPRHHGKPVHRAPAVPCALTHVARLCTVWLMSTSSPKPEPKVDFEAAMRELEAVVDRLERGDLPLEESLAAFERGVLLTRGCQSALKEAEQKVEILLSKAGATVVENFETGDAPTDKGPV